MKTLEGKLVAEGLKIGIVAARFNEFIVNKLVSGAEDACVRHGVNDDDITLAWVPGAFEIPIVAKKMAQSGKYDAILCLGAVIKGSTDHYDYVCAEVSKGIAMVGMETGVPTMFGVLTTDNIEQAIERAGTKAGKLPEQFVSETGCVPADPYFSFASDCLSLSPSGSLLPLVQRFFSPAPGYVSQLGAA